MTSPRQPSIVAPVMRFIPVSDRDRSVAFYCDVIGFDRDKVTLQLIARTEAHKGISSFTVYIEDADTFYAELVEKSANVLGPPVSRPWGLRDFTMADPEGNRITFAQPFE
jgi:predicted enzyme related to lactoylglutathione lyase